MKTFGSVILTLCFVSLIVISGCRHQRTHSATEKHYDLKGKVVLVEKDQHLVTVAHEDIKDYMPAMTMPFAVGEDWWWIFELPLVPGDHINATLMVDGAKSWLEDVVIAKEGSDSGAPVSGEGIGSRRSIMNCKRNLSFTRKRICSALVLILNTTRQRCCAVMEQLLLADIQMRRSHIGNSLPAARTR